MKRPEHAGIAVLLALALVLAGCANQNEASLPQGASYGVLIGAGPEDTEQLAAYRTVVVDAAYFTKEEIDFLHRKGSRVYSYLNVGSIETFRDAYAQFQSITLAPYENWPGEFWVDVSSGEWQRYITDTAAGALAEKGVDGFFLDNTDVYYLYPSQDVFDGLSAIVGGLGQYGKDIILNGGDVFVSKAVLEPGHPLVSITGVNQECVFTAIDFSANTLLRQQPEETDYYLDYLEQCREKNLAVYLTEYAPTDQRELRRTIVDYCEEQGYFCYLSPSIQLNGQ